MRVTPEQVALFRKLRTLDELATLLGTSSRRLSHLLYRAPHPYRCFTIPKKGGGERVILAPPNPIGAFQRLVHDCIAAVYIPARMVHGFAPARSVATNAKTHVGRRLLLNFDLSDFFPTINFGRVRGVFRAAPFRFPDNVASVLAHLCCYQGKLPQGAPTSPIISNLVCRGLDKQMVALARASGCTYTRYADDITLSTNATIFPEAILANSFALPPEIGSALLNVVTGSGFSVNPKKTRYADRRMRQEVTGLTVNTRVNVRRAYVRELRGALRAWERDGEKLANEAFHIKFSYLSRRQPPVNLRAYLRGRLAYLRMVRGAQDPIYLWYAMAFSRLANEPGVHLTGASASIPAFAKNALWTIVAKDEDGNDLFHGTGFSLERHGIVTSEHVFRDEKGEAVLWEAIPAWSPGRRFRIDRVTVSPHFDLALVPAPINSPAAFAAERSPTSSPDAVTLLGFPLWAGPHENVHVAQGTVTTRRTISLVHHLLVSVAIHGGNSGGPLLNAAGMVAGVARYDAKSIVAPNGVVSIVHAAELSNPKNSHVRVL